MGTMIQVGNDVVTFLKEQHDQIKALFQQVITTRGEARTHAFYALRRMLAVHETAEEEVVHPAARKALPDGEEVVQARLQEERDAKEVLAKIEKLDVDSAEFDTRIRELQASVLAHAESEERYEFDRIGAIFDEPKLARMRQAAEFAEKVAPTHPHPGVESTAANLLVGPFASMIDRARDALGARH